MSYVRHIGMASLVLVVANTAACSGRPRAGGQAPRSGPTTAVFDLTQGAPEQDPPGILGVAPRKRSFVSLLRAIDEAAKDPKIKSFAVRLGAAPIGMARSEEIGTVFNGIRGQKPVTCHADGFVNSTLLLAARGCSKVYVSPAGEVEATGIAAQIVYMRKLLVDELKLSIDILQVGKYKGAEEPLTRDGPSEEARASLESVLADERTAWQRGIREGRSKEGIDTAAEDGPYSARRSKEIGLVDEVAYWDEALTAAKDGSGAVRDEVRFGPSANADDGSEIDEIVRLLSGGSGDTQPIALIRAIGSISMTGGGMLGGRGGITEKELGKLLTRAEKDDDIRAVVVRMDSPGGSALASDLLWHAMMRVKKKKPLVVSVGEYAASGGYYISSAANAIFADEASIVGSIGVVGGKVGVGGLLERFGVHTETFAARRDQAAATRGAYLSYLVPWDDPTRERVLETMQGIYDLFLARIAEGRSSDGRTMTPDQVAPHAEGRIFSGTEAKKRGLVDEVGGLRDAIARARSMAHLPEDAGVGILGGKSGLLDALEGGGSNPDPGEGRMNGADLLSHVSPALLPFLTGLAPLAEGELAVAAMPYGIERQ